MKRLRRTLSQRFAHVLTGALAAASLLFGGPNATAKGRLPVPPLPESLPVAFHASFDEYYSFNSTNELLSIPNCCDLVESWSGYALLSWNPNGTVTPFIVPGVDATGHTNLMSAGAVRFWLTPYWSSAGLTNGANPPGSIARLLTFAGAGSGQAVECWSLQATADGSTISLVQQSDAGPVELLRAPIAWSGQAARCITLNYGSQGTALFVDGQLSAQGPGTVAVPPSASQLVIGSSLAGTETAQGAIDEVYIFSRPVAAEELTFYYAATVKTAALGPMTDAEMIRWKLKRAANFAGQTLASASTMQTMETSDTEPPPAPGGDEGSGDPQNPAPAPVDYSSYTNALYIRLLSVDITNGLLNVALYNTTNSMLYEILSKQSLTDALWISEGTLAGAPNQNWTATNLAMGDRTNNPLFLRARNLTKDSLAIGLPDWWQIQWFGTTGVDPYADGDGDGWANIDEFQRGTSPRLFNKPPVPQGLTVSYSGNVSNLVVTWERSPGPVREYVLARNTCDGFFFTTDYFTNSTTSFADATFSPDFLNLTYPPTFSVMACYDEDFSEWSAPVTVFRHRATLGAQVVRGPQGNQCLVLSGMPSDTVAIRLSRYISELEPTPTGTLDVPCSSITNGIYVLPESLAPFFQTCIWYVQTIDSKGQAGDAVFAEGCPRIPFYDGREHLVQNIAFQLRAATANTPLVVFANVATYDYPTNYVWASFHDPAGDPAHTYFDEFRPFTWNYLYRNFVFTLADVDESGKLKSDIRGGPLGFSLGNECLYAFSPPTDRTTPPSMLFADQSQWTYNDPAFAAIGLSRDDSGGLRLSGGVRNLFGLEYRAVMQVWGNTPSTSFMITPGQVGPARAGSYYLYPKADQPIMRTTDYCFYRFYIDPLPGNEAFSSTNTTPLLTTSVGDSFAVAGYAKQVIENGDLTKPVFLGQYFDKAYKIDPSGNVTTNETGVLSPYGEFFPTEPEPTALVTMPNWGTEERGTAVVHVISMNVDANHDGVMDFSYCGPDQTTENRPFRFWINDNDDSGDFGGTGIPGQGANANGVRITDWDFFGFPIYRVQGTRDLVDFFPVSVNIGCLFQSNALSAGISITDTNYQFILSQADGVLRFAYTDLTPTNYMNFLRDSIVSSNLATARLTTITNVVNGGVALSQSFLAGIANNNQSIILVEAFAATTQPLVLTIYHGTNQIAQTQLALSIAGVEQMFRHKNLIAETFPNPDSLGGPADRLTDGSVPNEPGTNGKNFVFLHGYNVNPDEARGVFADTFKRMYWSGSHAKFYGVTWRGSESQGKPIPGVTGNYHTNVANAFLTAPHLADFLATLTGPTTIAAHSLGNMVVLSAINDWNAPFNKYFMLDAAVATEAIDASVSATVPMIHSEWTDPSPYHTPYDRHLWASSWYGLFSAGDGRNTLTWSNRFSSVPLTKIYNFYSSGEEVLREYDNDPPLEQLGTVEALVNYMNNHPPIKSYVWVWQEKGKGRSPVNNVLGSAHGGWKFNDWSYGTNSIQNPSVWWHMSPDQAALLPDSQLRTNAFFDLTTSPSDNADLALEGANGSACAQANRYRILADAIPALTLPIGANPVSKLTPQNGDDQNFNMQALFENSWPQGRLVNGEKNNNWYHSDFRDLAYPFTYPLFNKWVELGNLK